MIFIGNFLYVTNQQESEEEKRRHGGFNLVVEANDYDEAIIKFKNRILKMKERKDFFEGRCSIFFTHLFEFDMLPKEEAMMLNFQSVAGDPDMPFIGCSLPTDQSDACKIYNWQENVPEIEGKNEQAFIQFEK